MNRARVAAVAASLVVLSLGDAVLAASAPVELAALAAAVTWPMSTGLLLAELQTGGASASDEFIEITNAGPVAVDLAGLEVAYVTSTGGTVTRKASWAASVMLEPGRHLLIANVSGIYASIADATYSGGFAATGGALVVRPIGGAPIDAVGWGDATNGFVEDAVAPAPAAGSSIERLPGGLGGNTIDTNANALDWFVQAVPNPQNLAAPPLPAPMPSGTPMPTEWPAPSPTPEPSATSEPGATPEPSADPSMGPSPAATSSPSPSGTPGPTETPTPDTSPSVDPTTAPTPDATPRPSATPTATPTAPSATPSAAPSVMPTESATPGPVPAPTTTPAPSASPAPTPSPVPSPMLIHEARAAGVGATVTVAGVVTAEAGRLGTPPLIAIADSTGGIVVRVPDGAPSPGRGAMVRVTGPLAEPYGQLEVRPALAGFSLTGTGVLPGPIGVTAADLGEGTEGLLVAITGTATSKPSKATSGDLTIELVDAAGDAFRALVDGSSGIAAADVPLHQALQFTGVVGQRASRKGMFDGYRIWLRDRGDIVLAPRAGPSASPGPRTDAVPIAAALAAPDGANVAIEAVVTAGASLLDSTGRRIVVQDASGAIEVLLPMGTAGPPIGTRLRVVGEKVHAWGAPRLRATSVTRLGDGSAPGPAARTRKPVAGDEWRLVRLSGTILRVERMGDRWRAEVQLANGDRVPVLGQAGAAIPSTSVIEGRAATIVGIVRRPYPTATDRRFALLPRGVADLALGPADPSAASGAGDTGDGGAGAAAHGAGLGSVPAGDGGPTSVTPDTDLATLSERVGDEVRVGGLVTGMTVDGFLLDDGTAVVRIVLGGDALALLPHIEPGDALAVRGTVRQVAEELQVAVASAADLVRVGALGQAVPVLAGSSAEPGATAGADRGASLATAELGGLLPAEVSVATLGSLAGASLLVTLLRRRAAARRSRAAVLARLAGLTRGLRA